MKRDGARSVNSWSISKRLDVKFVERILKCQNAITLDKLYDMADAAGVEPWQLLLEDWNPEDMKPAQLDDDDRRLLTRLRGLLSNP